MLFKLNPHRVGFPDPSLAEPDGLLAFGGGMSPEWLLNAYYMGIFPWYIHRGMPHWYAPSQRMVLFPEEFHCSNSLRRVIRSGRFEVRIDTCFREVMEHCAAAPRQDQGGTWINKKFIDSYCQLHEQGFAHSFETFQDGKLVGGLYGVSLSDYFCGESMFHDVTDASKVAFARLVQFAQLHGFRLIDAQLYTPHLASLGAREIDRDEFVAMLNEQDIHRTIRGRWRQNSVVLLLGGNQGDRISLLMRAIAEIARRIGTVSVASTVYETEPWGFEAEQSFLNQAVVVDTDLPAQQVLETALQIEKELGRQRPQNSQMTTDNSQFTIHNSQFTIQNYQSRPIDIDLIFYNDMVVDTPSLTLPHPRMHLRRFVLEPLSQIIPDFFHPIFKKTITQLWQECPDNSEVKPYI